MPTDDEPTMCMSVRIPETLHRRLKIEAVKTERTVSSLVIEALREALAKQAAV